MSASHNLSKTLRTESDGDNKIPRRLWAFLVLGLAMLLFQYPMGLLRLHGAWDIAVFALLFHSVVILVDAACAVGRGSERVRARGMRAYFLPVEGRGLPQLITLVACIGVMAAAMKLHDLGSSASYWQQ